ncbi:hypothetical protein LTR64_000256 [Lithohypha guttulata]|uniref:uncharacterized protein n=1 Tax=Lithohypha guttulata TaxID=1690604 RepID=UPI00315C80D0
MIRFRHGTPSLILLIVLGLLLEFAVARRQKSRAANTIEPLPLALSGWTVPREGAETCNDNNQCTNTLPGPPISSNLEYLAIGRGTITYSCAGRSGTQQPLYVTQNAFLYDASPLIPQFSSEEQFHSYVPRFLDYDYTSIDNSSLMCIGDLQRKEGLTIFDIYMVDAFSVKVKEVVYSPDNIQFDLQWAHSRDDDDEEWDIYRVETAGGGPPYNCGDQIISDEIPVEYAAEYWFYHKSTAFQEATLRIS